MRTFGADIRRYRAAENIPQKVLAAMLGVSVTVVAKWEAGRPVPAHYRDRLTAIMAGSGNRVPINLRAMLSQEVGVACITSANGVVLDVSRAGIIRSDGRQLTLIGRNIYDHFNENSSLVRERFLADFLGTRGEIAQISFVDRCVINPDRAVRRNWTRIVMDGTVYRYTLDEDLGSWDGAAELDLRLTLRDELRML